MCWFSPIDHQRLRLTPPDPVWPHLTPFDPVWPHLTPPDPVWPHLSPPDPFDLRSRVSCPRRCITPVTLTIWPMWPHRTAFDVTWPCFTPPDPVWPQISRFPPTSLRTPATLTIWWCSSTTESSTWTSATTKARPSPTKVRTDCYLYKAITVIRLEAVLAGCSPCPFSWPPFHIPNLVICPF